MPNITFSLEGAGIKADTFLQDLEQEKDKIKVPIPQVGDVKLEIPPFFAQQDQKGGWKLVNPLTLVRNLATRKGKKTIDISRKNVETAKVEDDGRRDAPLLSAFSQRDQNRIIRYYKGVSQGRDEQYQTKNKQRGFPATLYKNARKAGLTEDPNTKTYAPNKKKARATYTPRPRQSRRRQIVLSSFDPENPLRRVQTPPPSPPESPRRAPSPPPQSDEESSSDEEEEETQADKVNKLFDELVERGKSAFSKAGQRIYRDDYNKALALYRELSKEDQKQIKAKALTVKATIQSFSNPSNEPTEEELEEAEEVSKKYDFYGRAIKQITKDIKNREQERRDFGTTERDEVKMKELKATLAKLEKGKEEGKPLWEVDNYLFQVAFKTSVPSSSKDYEIVKKVWQSVFDKNQKGKGLAGVDSDSDSSSDEETDGGALRLGGKKGMRKVLLQPDDGGLNEVSMGMTPETDGMEAGSLFSMIKDFISPAKQSVKVEQTLSNKELQDLLAKSYEEGLGDYGDFKVDRELSNPITQVYYNPQRNQPVVVHRGSAEGQDWRENAEYSLLNKKTGSHFKTAEDIQRRAEAKYGTENLTTIGHSKGATHAEEFGKRGRQIITLNKPVSPYDLVSKIVPENQIDIKTSGDPVSLLRGLQFGNKARVLESKSSNPLAEHSVNVLEGTGLLDDLFRRLAGRRDARIAPTETELHTLPSQTVSPPSRTPPQSDPDYIDPQTQREIQRGFERAKVADFLRQKEGIYTFEREKPYTQYHTPHNSFPIVKQIMEEEMAIKKIEEKEARDKKKEEEREERRMERERKIKEREEREGNWGRKKHKPTNKTEKQDKEALEEWQRANNIKVLSDPPIAPSFESNSSGYGLRRDPRWKGFIR